jgi:chorismate mutase
MPSTLPVAEPKPDQDRPSLAELRAELDGMDDAIHDLLMRRADIVSQVAALNAKVPFRPGREAEILRRLVRRHKGPLPARVVPRVWRELLAGTTSMQGLYLIAVCEADAGQGFVQCAREHFGALTPLRVHRSPAQALAEVSAGMATAAVLPLPEDSDSPQAAWWTALLHRDDPRIHIVARLPFWAPRPEGAPQVQAFVVAAAAPDESSHDRSVIGFELSPETSRARLSAALAEAGFAPVSITLRRDPATQSAHGLIEVDGYVTDGDPRLAALTGAVQRPVVLGSYAVPLDGETP